MTSLSTALGLLKVKSHRLEHALAKHLSHHTDMLWRDVVQILRTKPPHAWEVLILERHRLYVALAHLEYEVQIVRIASWHRTQLRSIFAKRFPWLTQVQEDVPALASLFTVGLSLAAENISKWLTKLGLFTSKWFLRTRAASPAPILKTLKQAMQKPEATVETVLAEVKPKIQQAKNSISALARNAVAVVNTQSVMGVSRKLGCAGFQVHSVLEPVTRWKHRLRHGTKYYFKLGLGEFGVDACPQPPYEADGSLAHNCLCWITPLFADTLFPDDEVDADVIVRWFKSRPVPAAKARQPKIVAKAVPLGLTLSLR